MKRQIAILIVMSMVPLLAAPTYDSYFGFSKKSEKAEKVFTPYVAKTLPKKDQFRMYLEDPREEAEVIAIVKSNGTKIELR